MNVTLNTFNTYNQQNRFNKMNTRPQSFTANAANGLNDAAKAAVKTAEEKSSIFKPLSDFYDRFTDSVTKHFTSKVVDSKPMNYIADKFKDSSNLFQHCLTIGSLITSGLYMEKTLTNDKLDKDRKQTLAVNQGLTYLLRVLILLTNTLRTGGKIRLQNLLGIKLITKNLVKTSKASTKVLKKSTKN